PEIHIFCNASEQAYIAVAYLRSENNKGQVEVTFMAASSSPYPLSKLLVTELTIPIHSVTLWSDSTTVLTWLKSSSCRYKVFVGTRVAEIQELTASATWYYVKSGDNPADDITRGREPVDCHQIAGLNKLPYLLKIKAVMTAPTPLPKPEQYDTLSDYLNACGQELHGAAYTSCADIQRE
ncbi:hypothetical protein M9458_047182, partial [Cirrhinus mrigala]